MSEKVTKSCGNVFEDLGLPNAGERKVKADIALKISTMITRQGFTQKQAAKVLGVDQPRVSDLMRGKLSGFTVDRLLGYINTLGSDVEIVVKRRRTKYAGETRVAL